MTKTLFRQSFLFDSLDLDQEVFAEQTVLSFINVVYWKSFPRIIVLKLRTSSSQQVFMVMKLHRWS